MSCTDSITCPSNIRVKGSLCCCAFAMHAHTNQLQGYVEATSSITQLGCMALLPQIDSLPWSNRLDQLLKVLMVVLHPRPMPAAKQKYPT